MRCFNEILIALVLLTQIAFSLIMVKLEDGTITEPIELEQGTEATYWDLIRQITQTLIDVYRFHSDYNFGFIYHGIDITHTELSTFLSDLDPPINPFDDEPIYIEVFETLNFRLITIKLRDGTITEPIKLKHGITATFFDLIQGIKQRLIGVDWYHQFGVVYDGIDITNTDLSTLLFDLDPPINPFDDKPIYIQVFPETGSIVYRQINKGKNNTYCHDEEIDLQSISGTHHLDNFSVPFTEEFEIEFYFRIKEIMPFRIRTGPIISVGNVFWIEISTYYWQRIEISWVMEENGQRRSDELSHIIDDQTTFYHLYCKISKDEIQLTVERMMIGSYLGSRHSDYHGLYPLYVWNHTVPIIIRDLRIRANGNPPPKLVATSYFYQSSLGIILFCTVPVVVIIIICVFLFKYGCKSKANMDKQSKPSNTKKQLTMQIN